MKFIIMTIIIMIFLIYSISYAEINDEVLLEGAKYGDDLINSGIGNLTYEWIRVDSTSIKAYKKDKESLELGGVIQNYWKYDVFFAFDGPKIRCNVSTIGK